MSTNEQRITALELDVQMLKLALAGLGGANNEAKQAPSNGQAAQRAQSAPQTQKSVAFSDDMLDREWADKEIKKDPKRWIDDGGESYVGRTMSRCPPDYLEAQADFFDWKVRKGKEENPVRTNDKGEPWYKSDEINARLCRAWANRQRAAMAPVPARRAPPAPEPPIAEEDIPF